MCNNEFQYIVMKTKSIFSICSVYGLNNTSPDNSKHDYEADFMIIARLNYESHLKVTETQIIIQSMQCLRA